MINIDNEIKEALLAHDTLATNMYRLIKAEILSFKTAKNAKEYNDAAEVQLLRKMIKQREDSISMYVKANRDDLVDKESAELAFLTRLLPESPSEEMIKLELVSLPYAEFNPETGAYPIDKKDMGKAIKDLKVKFPTADGKVISNIVKSYIV